MKTKKFWLPCIAAVAIATFVGAKSFKTNASESNDLLLANVEALSTPSDPGAGTSEKFEYCVESHSTSVFAHGSHYKCADGTTMILLPLPSSPKDGPYTYFPCTGPKGKSTLLTKMGFCTLSK